MMLKDLLIAIFFVQLDIFSDVTFGLIVLKEQTLLKSLEKLKLMTDRSSFSRVWDGVRGSVH